MITDHHTHTSSCWWQPDRARWACLPDSDDAARVDVRDMLVVHAAMLREFRLAPAAVTRTADGDRAQAAAVADHLAFVSNLLHHHHQGEDALLWPVLRPRVTRAQRRLIDDAEAQHKEIDAALDQVAECRTAWAAEPGPAFRDRLAAALQHLHTVLRDHLDAEERELLPLAATHLAEPEWQAIGAGAVATMPRSALPLTFGMFAYEADPAVLRMMLGEAPMLPRILLPRLAPRVYAKRARRVHGTATP